MALTWTEEEVATSIVRYQPTMTDNVIANNPLLTYLKENGNLNLENGGTQLGHEVHLASNPSGKYYYGLEQLNTTSAPVMKQALFDWKQYNINIIISGRDMRINMGTAAKHKLLEERIKNAETTMKNTISVSLYGDGTGSSGKDIGGLQYLIPDAAGTVGGISQSAEPNWRNQLYDFSVESVTPSKDTIVKAMDTLFRRCTFGNEKPTLIVAGETYFSYYEDAVGALKSINVNATQMTQSLGDAGFTMLYYKGVPVVYDGNCSATRMYMLNMNHIFFEVHKDANFSLGENRKPYDQDGMLFPILFQGNLTTNGPKFSGVMIA